MIIRDANIKIKNCNVFRIKDDYFFISDDTLFRLSGIYAHMLYAEMYLSSHLGNTHVTVKCDYVKDDDGVCNVICMVFESIEDFTPSDHTIVVDKVFGSCVFLANGIRLPYTDKKIYELEAPLIKYTPQSDSTVSMRVYSFKLKEELPFRSLDYIASIKVEECSFNYTSASNVSHVLYSAFLGKTRE